ncbi:ABC transporter ATP-binding protein [Aerococcaceae bacterium INB8]|uniref:ABC transporter ATP-binding protein n=1 Tax=Ruoffia halotolerans TaxID=2748684 RepID=A0A839A6Q1_9LACT|nr:ABC transporter ATP-binding protein [Ruoffia halotolerans]MBA5729571.1 ABC transporter ATP-binding protein [Ruoffia halotolerans]
MKNSLVLEVNNVSKQYGKQQALEHFNLNVNKGEIVGVAGPNGAGKTTLFRIITGMTPIYDGDLKLFGSLDAAGLRENRKYLGTIIEDPAFFPEMSAKQNLEFYRIQRGVKDKNRIDKLLTLVGLADVGNKKFKGFSLGMKQRLAIALALIHEPELLVFDEPTNGLDPAGIIQVRKLLQKLAKETNLTILVSSHILSELENLATRFVIVNHGKKIDEFTKEELQERLQSYFKFKVDDTDRASQLLETELNTTEFEVTAEGMIHVFDPNIEASDIADTFVKNNLKLSHLSRNSHNLEEMFINLTEEAHFNDEII